jgi:very-short-patch-repair endonuclease
MTHLKQAARTLRTNMTLPEQILWSYIRRKKIHGVQFYRQKVLGPYIVDFYAPKIRLVIELDGAQHNEPEHKAQDKYRDEYLAAAKIMVLRISNNQITKQLNQVLNKLDQLIRFLI